MPSVTLPAPSTGTREVETVQLATRSQPSGEIKPRSSGIESLFAVAGDVSALGNDRSRSRNVATLDDAP